MIGFFRQKNPGNIVVVFLYALALRLPSLLYPETALRTGGDHILYQKLLGFLDPIHRVWTSSYAVLAFLLVLIQASLLNRACNALRMFPKQHYLVAMAYILITSLLPAWQVFSAPLLINTLLIWAWYSMMSWYNSPKAKSQIFNTGLVIGVLPLIYSPAIVYILLLLLAILVIRPFRLTEWIVGLLGVLTPYYFTAIGLFLTDQWKDMDLLPGLQFGLPELPTSLWVTAAWVALLWPFVAGGYFVQDQLNKMLIQVRKGWSMLLLMLIVSILLLFLTKDKQYESWLLLMVPLAVFHAAAYYFPQGKWIPNLTHWALFLLAAWQLYARVFVA